MGVILKDGEKVLKRYNNLCPFEWIELKTGEYILDVSDSITLISVDHPEIGQIKCSKYASPHFYLELNVCFGMAHVIELFLDERGVFTRKDDEVWRSSIEALFSQCYILALTYPI